MTSPRFLYLVRHGEAFPDGPLTPTGRRQAALLGERLGEVTFDAVHHSPVLRAAETCALITASGTAHEAAGDYVPYQPSPGEAPPHLADFAARFPERRDLAAQAEALFTGPAEGDEPRRELVVTHNFLVGWLVRHALGAPGWRWLTVNACNAALTVILYAPDRPPSLMLFNDMSHLPAELRWTGFSVRP
ncbi:histidine phosphatase family protein [Nonomuraea soli]|uniref:Putative phosphoglycerate mutase n=1 Tax=Nonomuraea soli TaxID=1032476 RepID=A0A7W0CMU4_9ACTN|nr:histidine phosphatase family protein [Nonomuraea soli]MBA2894087.1 putative phosphoglycerate mutase [Nonomuraea soli]